MNDKNKLAAFYKSLLRGITTSKDDLKRNYNGRLYYHIDTCFIHPLITGFNKLPKPENWHGALYTGATKETDVLGAFLMNRLIERTDSSVNFIMHPMIAWEIILMLSQKADQYKAISEKGSQIVKIDKHKYVDSTDIVRDLDALMKQFSQQENKFPGIEKLICLFKKKKIIGHEDAFNLHHPSSIRKPRIEDANYIEEKMMSGRRHNNDEVQIKFKTDAAVLSETYGLNKQFQVGFITKSYPDEFFPARDYRNIIRSPHSSLIQFYVEDLCKEYSNDSEFISNASIELEILFEEVYPIYERIKNFPLISSAPTAIRRTITNFEKTKLKDIMGNKNGTDENTLSSEDDADYASKFRDASESLNKSTKLFLEEFPDLAGEDVLYDYGLENHPMITSLKRKLDSI